MTVAPSTLSTANYSASVDRKYLEVTSQCRLPSLKNKKRAVNPENAQISLMIQYLKLQMHHAINTQIDKT